MTGDPRLVATGLVFGESPRWHSDTLYVSDWGAHEVLAVAPNGTTEVVARHESFPMCIDFLPDGRLLVVSAAQRKLLVQQPDGALTRYADLAPLSEHGFNDIVVDGRGNAYVNTPNFAFPGGEFAPGLLALVTPDGVARLVADDLHFPNGVAVTPDNRTLIIAESYGNRLTAFDIADDGSLAGRRVWADLGTGAPDGICIDADGAVWYADVPNRCCVRVREGGEVLQTIDLDRGCFACILGGPQRRTLFLVATEWRGTGGLAQLGRTGQVLSIPAPAPGAGWP
jgi:sugar lactone lactonase YvrE